MHSKKLQSSKKFLCPCSSDQLYSKCCRKYHEGALPPTALELMRSRYSAYALGLSDYIIKTTHPSSPYFNSNRQAWLKELSQFSSEITFEKLEVLDAELGENESFVSFVAHLSKDKIDLTFSEKSFFLKENHSWKYVQGKLEKGKLTKEMLNRL